MPATQWPSWRAWTVILHVPRYPRQVVPIVSQCSTSKHGLGRPSPQTSIASAFLALVLITGCLSGSDAPDATVTTNVPTATTTIPALPTTPTAEPSPTIPPSLERLLDPGPTAQGPRQIIFRYSDSLWVVDVDGQARRLTRDVQVNTWAQTISGTVAAFVETRESDGRTLQVVRFVSADGFMTGVEFGPIYTSGPDAEPEIVELAWSWDATSLGILRSDGHIQALVGLNDPFVDSSTPMTLVPPTGDNRISNITWGPTGDGIAYLLEGAGGRSSLMLAPRDVEPFDVLTAEGGLARTVADFHWLPGRGRIAFVENSPVPGSRTPASIFTVAPDGTALELLVSASLFAPAATVGSMNASPDGRELSFILLTPDRQGQPAFQSLWVLHIDSGELREVEIEAGYVVSDTWFVSGGLLWRGVDVGAQGPESGITYTGSEPFILGFTDNEGNTTILFQSSLAEDQDAEGDEEPANE